MTLRRSCLLVFSLIVLSVGFAPDAWAQSADDDREPAEITERQVELNEEGVRAIIDGDHQKAIAVLSESLAYGEANATYLNLGRAYQKLGNCMEAREALSKALTAPVVDDPPPRVIDKKAKEYLGELEEECPDEEPADEAQDEEPQEEPAPKEEPEQPDETAEEKDAPKDTPEKTAEKDQQDIQDPGPAPQQDKVDSGGNGLAWASIGVGAAFVGGGVAMHMLAVQERNPVYDAYQDGDTVIQYPDTQAAEAQDRANLYDTIGLSADIAGGALIGVGVVLLLTGPDSAESASFNVTPLDGGAAASYRIKF